MRHSKSEINNTQIDNAKYIDVVMPMYILIEYSDNHSETSESLWQYYRDDPNDNITRSESYQYKAKITRKVRTNGNTKDVKIALYENNLVLTWSEGCVISSAPWQTKLKITDTKPYLSVVTLSTQDNAKLLLQLKSGFKRAINWNKYQTKVSTSKSIFRFLNWSKFLKSKQTFCFIVWNTGYYLPKVEIKDCNAMIDGKNFFD